MFLGVFFKKRILIKKINKRKPKPPIKINTVSDKTVGCHHQLTYTKNSAQECSSGHRTGCQRETRAASLPRRMCPGLPRLQGRRTTVRLGAGVEVRAPVGLGREPTHHLLLQISVGTCGVPAELSFWDADEVMVLLRPTAATLFDG